MAKSESRKGINRGDREVHIRGRGRPGPALLAARFRPTAECDECGAVGGHVDCCPERGERGDCEDGIDERVWSALMAAPQGTARKCRRCLRGTWRSPGLCSDCAELDAQPDADLGVELRREAVYDLLGSRGLR